MAEISPLRRRMIEDMTVRNLSPATQQSYLNAVSKLSRYFGRSPDRLGLEDVHAFQVHLVATGISWPSLNQIVCALRFFYGVTLGQDAVPERIAYAREPSKLPVVLSADEVVRFLEAIPSLKSRMALTTVYAAGLRVSEVVLLKIADIDSQRMVIRVEQGKGGKDRYVMLSPQLLTILRTYWRLARPQAMAVSRPRRRASARTQRIARRLPFSLRGGGLEQAGDGAHAAAHIRDPSFGEWGGRAHHPGPARPRQPRQARRATPGSPPKRSVTRRARSIGSAWTSCHPAERVPWLRLWRWRISSAAMAKRSDRRMPVISGASSDGSWAPSRRAGRRCSAAMSSNATIAVQPASLTTRAATVTVPNARDWRGPNGSRIGKPNCCRCRTFMSSSHCRHRSARSRSRTSPSSTRSCSARRPRHSPPSRPIPGISAPSSA